MVQVELGGEGEMQVPHYSVPVTDWQQQAEEVVVEARWQGVAALCLAWPGQGEEQDEEWLPLQGKLLCHDGYPDRSKFC